MPDNKTPKYQYDHYDFGDMLDSAVEAGSKIGSSVLGQHCRRPCTGGRCHEQAAARQLRRMEAPSGAQMEKRRPDCRRCADGSRLDLHGLLRHHGARHGHPDRRRCGAVGAFPTGFYSPADSDSRVLPRNARLPLYGHRGHEKLAYFSRLRKLLRAANDWTCDLPALTRKAQIKQEKAYETVAKAVANGDLPNAAISDDYSTLYLDDSLMPTAAKPAAAPQAEPAEPLTDAEQFRREGMDFLNYLKVCRGKLGTDADEELAAMQKTCASIMGFVHNHSEQLNRVRRFREYYLPTTRKCWIRRRAWAIRTARTRRRSAATSPASCTR